MLQVFRNANFRLMWGTKWIFLSISAVIMLAALATIVFKGFSYGIDFAGGTAVQVRFSEAPNIEGVRSALDNAGLHDVTLQRIGKEGDHEILIRVERDVRKEAAGNEGGQISAEVLEALRRVKEDKPADPERIDLNMATSHDIQEWLEKRVPPAAAGENAADPAAAAAAIVAARNAQNGLLTDIGQVTGAAGVTPAVAALLKEKATLGGFALRGVDFVGPTAGRELLANTGWAIAGSVIGILLYVWFRFHRIAWGMASVLALVHDVTIAAGAMSFTGKEFSLTVVAALLTILGYSINDTIVVFDRIRENLRLYRDSDFERVVNASVNQTLSRTILTSFTVFVAVFALFLYGGEKLNPMSFCLLVGVVFGTYSSVFVAAALLVVTQQLFGSKYVKI